MTKKSAIVLALAMAITPSVGRPFEGGFFVKPAYQPIPQNLIGPVLPKPGDVESLPAIKESAAVEVPKPDAPDRIVISIPRSSEYAIPQRPLGSFSSAMSQDLTANHDNLWERIRNGFAMPAVPGSLVADNERFYRSRPDYIKRIAERSRRYLHHIVEEIELRGMPTEIALLPIIESAFNPTAYSRSHAAGIWQFIPSTGKHFGLQQNFWYDGRRDVVAATDAALDYLTKLYEMFGSWDLALAAYNCGEGTLSRAIARNQARDLPTDYSSLQLPLETRQYLPKLQAVKNIVADPTQYGIELLEIPNEPYFTTVTAPKTIDVQLAAKLAEMPLDEFISLNPAHNRRVINGSRTLLLPIDKADAFSANLGSHKKPLVSWRTYIARRGESFDKIAGQFGISTNQLREINDLATRKTKTVAGQQLLVPISSKASATPGTIVSDKTKPAIKTGLKPAIKPAIKNVGSENRIPKVARQLQHVVRKGDTLFSISRHYDVSVGELKAWNRLRGNQLSPGQKLVLRPDSSSS